MWLRTTVNYQMVKGMGTLAAMRHLARGVGVPPSAARARALSRRSRRRRAHPRHRSALASWPLPPPPPRAPRRPELSIRSCVRPALALRRHRRERGRARAAREVVDARRGQDDDRVVRGRLVVSGGVAGCAFLCPPPPTASLRDSRPQARAHHADRQAQDEPAGARREGHGDAAQGAGRGAGHRQPVRGRARGANLATFLGHYPWFFTNNFLEGQAAARGRLRARPRAARSSERDCSSFVSDCVSSSAGAAAPSRRRDDAAPGVAACAPSSRPTASAGSSGAGCSPRSCATACRRVCSAPAGRARRRPPEFVSPRTGALAAALHRGGRCRARNPTSGRGRRTRPEACAPRVCGAPKASPPRSSLVFVAARADFIFDSRPAWPAARAGAAAEASRSVGSGFSRKFRS